MTILFIAWICALPVELAAAQVIYILGALNGHHVVITCLPTGIYGTISAATVVSRLISTFPHVQYTLMVGIGGGAPNNSNDIRLGDVVVSKPVGKYSGVIQYDYGKTIQGGQFEQTGTLNSPPQVLLTHIAHLQAIQLARSEDTISHIVSDVLERNPDMKRRFTPPSQHTDYLFQLSYHHINKEIDCGHCDKKQFIHRPLRQNRTPYIHYGLIASGDQVMKDSETRDRLAQQLGILCFEMEGAGLMNQLPTLVIRGISDYCDSHKQKQWQGYAALIAAAYAKLLLTVVPAYSYNTCDIKTTEKGSLSDSACLTPANAALREFYSDAKRLDIQRLSGKLLPMDHCYINLAIVEHSPSTKTHADQESSPFPLFSRLKVDTVNTSAQISLKTLFDPRKQSEEKVIMPKRILIQGRAGVGKTTLCKKIVYDYLYSGMWKDLFDWVFWVPLRKLKFKSSSTTYNMGDLFYDEYFSQRPQGRNLAQEMWSSVNEPLAREKTLFILDGLDEVPQNWGTPMDEFLAHLLRQPQVIVTTRPQTLNRNYLEPFDLELETIGFLPNQVMTYIEKVSDKDIAEQIQKFINSRWLIRGLVRIPIQLDALCYSWNHDFQLDGGPKNMTALYQAIMLKLWTKDIDQLEKTRYGKQLTKNEVLCLRTAKQIEPLVEDEIEFLESLAFSGLYNNIVDFNS
ncbi:hypothetical protein EYB26_003891 [Talaromyces marneffei]|uniref:uncharacterized protein n=1 Tax=Talaromyces marneffei TaxID=37727 RepID=UPI0012AA60EF|nr:uncharacterized protein EYB26_003891 [Talaromyces marneffei]QGA16224.1 hypothetical protein EYB26_003891 [Talaromyces marneffei]